MERLTDNTNYCSSWSDCEMVEGKCVFYGNCYDRKIYNKLKYYEDLEEQNLLLKLPCKVGAKVYHVAFNYKTTRKEKIVETTFSLEMLEDYKKWWFLTEAEAEKALAEMEK